MALPNTCLELQVGTYITTVNPVMTMIDNLILVYLHNSCLLAPTYPTQRFQLSLI